MKDIEVLHQFYPKGKYSWCKYQRDKASGEKSYKANLNIPKWIHDISSNQFLLSYHLRTYYQNVFMGVRKIQASHYIVPFE